MSKREILVVSGANQQKRGYKPELAALGADRSYWRDEIRIFFLEHEAKIVAARERFGFRELPGKGHCRLLVSEPESLGEAEKDTSFLSRPGELFIPRFTVGLRKLLLRSGVSFSTAKEMTTSETTRVFQILLAFFSEDISTRPLMRNKDTWWMTLVCVSTIKCDAKGDVLAPEPKIDVLGTVAKSRDLALLFGLYFDRKIDVFTLHARLKQNGLVLSEMRVANLVRNQDTRIKLEAFATVAKGDKIVDAYAATSLASATAIAANHDVSFIAYGKNLDQIEAVQAQARKVASIVAPRLLVQNSDNAMNRSAVFQPGQKPGGQKGGKAKINLELLRNLEPSKVSQEDASDVIQKLKVQLAEIEARKQAKTAAKNMMSSEQQTELEALQAKLVAAAGEDGDDDDDSEHGEQVQGSGENKSEGAFSLSSLTSDGFMLPPAATPSLKVNGSPASFSSVSSSSSSSSTQSTSGLKSSASGSNLQSSASNSNLKKASSGNFLSSLLVPGGGNTPRTQPFGVPVLPQGRKFTVSANGQVTQVTEDIFRLFTDATTEASRIGMDSAKVDMEGGVPTLNRNGDFKLTVVGDQAILVKRMK